MIEVVIHIHNKKVVNMDEFRAAFNELKNGKHLVTVKDIRKRSIPQNSYYWAVVVPLVRRGLYDIGFDEVQTNDDAHRLLKKQFIRKEFINKKTGEVARITGKSSGLSIPEFNEYIERICKWSAEYLDVVIPSPNQEFAVFEEWENSIVHESF